MWLAIVGILFCGFPGRRATGEPKAKNVLVLFSSLELQENTSFLDAIEPPIRARIPGPITFYPAHLINSEDAELDNRYTESQAETFRVLYAHVKWDVVLAVAPQAVHFAVQYRDTLFRGAPIVFAQVTREQFDGLSWPGVTGVTLPLGIAQTIDFALRLQPRTKTVAVISGPDPLSLPVTHAELLRRKIKEIDFIEPPSRGLLKQVTALPPSTIVLFYRALDSERPELGAAKLLDAVARRFPTYSAWPANCLDHGCIGGVSGDPPRPTASVVDMVVRVLSGERAENIPVVHDGNFYVTVNWRALRRWHIPESALPPHTAIMFREPTLWERDKKHVIIALAMIAALMLLIIGLLWQRARKRKAEAVLRESEDRFRVMADTTPSLIWMCDEIGKITYLNERRIAFTGPDPHARYGEIWIANVHPDDVNHVLDTLYNALEKEQAFSQEYRLRRSDGVYRWMLDVASARVNGDGSFAGFIGSAIDTTDQKLAQRALEKVSGQLIEAQEKERSRIARDLHDDICQRLALLSMELEQANRNSTGSPITASGNLEEIRKHCSEISTHVHLLSHQLHSSKLDYLGVVAAIRGMCKESEAQHQISIVFRDKDVPKQLPKDVSLCLFRVAQEAVHNAVKYSGAREFSVEIAGLENEIHLMVEDTGAGFDVEQARKTQGLGLVSMQERLNLVHGRFTVESQPGKGTKIIAIVPLRVESVDIEAASLTRVVA